MAENMGMDADTMRFLRGSRAVAFTAGVLAIAAGIAVLAWPNETIKVVAVLVGIMLVISGVATALDALTTHRRGSYWGLVLVRGLLDLAIGLMAIFWTGITVWVLVVLVGIDLIIGGILSLIVSRSVPKEQGRSSFVGRGIVGIVLGLMILAWPNATVAVVALLLGIYLLLLGLLLLFAGYELGKLDRATPAT